MKIAALISGGVDSSVALSMLVNEGVHDITAFYLKIWLEDELQFLGECPWEEDLKYVRAVCDQLKIPLQVVPLQKEYNDRVVSYTIQELKLGHTPSPDIFCNQRVKFGAFLDYIDSSFDKIATGHYASTYEKDGHVYLKQAVDPIKDQSYFLSYLSQNQLQKCLFPLGPYPKSEIRKMATDLDLPTKDRPDSQGICFLGKIKYNDFVSFHLGKNPGDITEWETGKKLGRHEGYWFHTYGQRKGLKLHGGPWFVVEKDCEKNIIYVSKRDLTSDVVRTEYIATNVHWISGEPKETKLRVKLRHGPRMTDCVITKASDRNYHVTLSEADSGLANGQFSVFYDNDTCLGTGMIQLLPILNSTSDT
jgi:tRNA (5-methylaminomethyl-2-thiouridylate)-methyltransferase